MRQLVYRVRPLPQSMLPLIWDFGQLSEDVEYMYIVQMVRRFVSISLSKETVVDCPIITFFN